MVGSFLADVDAFGGGWREVEKVMRCQVVVEDDIGLGENALRFQGDQFGIAGSRAYEVDLVARGLHWDFSVQSPAAV